MYGSILTMVTFKPRASKSAATEAAEIPLPSDETTPPVTKIKWVIGFLVQSSLNRPAMLRNFTLLCTNKAKSFRINS